MSSSVTPVRRYGNLASGYESYMLVVHSKQPNLTQRNVPKPLGKRGPLDTTVVQSHSETVYPRPIHQLSEITKSVYPISFIQHKYLVCPAPEPQQARSQPTGNKKNDMILQTCDANVKHTMLNLNSQLICVKCNQCMFDANHDVCFLDFVNNVNVRSKSKSAKKSQHHNIWKPTGKVFTEVGHKWKPIGRLFFIVSNSCPLTRITPKKIVHLKETTSNLVETPKPEIKVYSKRPKQIKSVGSSNKAKIVESKIANNLEPTHLWGSNAIDVPSSSSIVNDRLSRLSSGSRDTNLYTISLDDMLKTSLICLLSKASKTKSWLWHHQLSHLNFSTLNKLAKDGLARDIPKLKFQKDHLCSACALGKSKKSSHQPKAEDTNHEKLYLLHMDLCGPMYMESINEKRYILLIVDDYSRFTWVKFLRSKDEAPDAIIKCIKNIQVRLNATVRNVRTRNGTEFVNQTLCDFYENASVSHQTSIARTPLQNDIVER
ncbi:retrovirus-related pol polyprotein from transposon TNT 1-94 [Tanacetum coccineum]|uniref:Retrovirus-related pol polyprotein from transposon TNT 1-94 n=1 Tax=Tanacetum coccineum TaxID=301880 RepID=A0ABQ5HMK6_9ASTR